MVEWNDFLYFINGAALLLSVLGLWFVAIIPGIDHWSKRFFQALFGVILLLCLSGIIEMSMLHYHVSRPALGFVLCLESLLLSLPQPILTAYLLHYCGEDLRSSKLLHTVIGLWGLHVVLLIIAPFIGGFFYISPDAQSYHRGPWYPFSLLPMFLVMLLNIAGAIRRRKRLSRKAFISFLIAMLPITAAMFVHMFIEVYALIDICTVLCSFSMYSLILSDQIEQDMRHREEIARQRASILILQMRPHFIYNTMTSIYHLCDRDAKKAQQVTLDFITYLRKNFNAIASDHTIAFSEELEHTRTYLAVEQAQYTNRLFVDYDTPHTGFNLPPLTLQPIVENSVKHGMDPDSDPLHISIRTRERDSGSEIIVEDNGSGFDYTDDSEPHIALSNIQQRLDMMCSGQMEILPREGGGTIVRIVIPFS